MGHDEEAAGTADEEEEGKSGEGRKIKNGHVGCEAPRGCHQVQNLELTKAQWMGTKIDFFERSSNRTFLNVNQRYQESWS